VLLRSQTQGRFLRDSVISGHVRDGAAPGDINAQARLKAAAVQMDASLLKIMQITSKGDRLEQALEAARLLTQIQSLDAAAKLAAFFHQPGLQERVLLIKEARSGEDAFEKERRESKWSHLIDNRTLVDSNRLAQDYSVEAISRSRKPATASSVLGRVVEVSHQKQSFGDSSALSAHKQFPPAAEAAKEDSGHGSSEPDYNETIPEEDDSLEHDLPMEDAAAASSSPAPVPPAKAPNPFAKATKPKAPPAVNSNPFAKKAAGNVKEIKRSDSFFNRVEAKTQGKAKAPRAAPKDASRQATIFGAAPPPEPEKPEPKKRGRKRKSDAEAEPEPVVEDPKVAKAKAEAAKQKKLSFGTKPAATASAEAEASATESGADVSLLRERLVEDSPCLIDYPEQASASRGHRSPRYDSRNRSATVSKTVCGLYVDRCASG
jgi:chromosome transmission fidelity protein 4